MPCHAVFQSTTDWKFWQLAVQVSEHRWKQRVEVEGPAGGREDMRVYEFTLVQREGGPFDGYFFVESLVAEEGEA